MWRKRSLLHQAWHQYRQGQWTAARQSAERFVQNNPQAEAYYLLGLVAEQVQTPLEAKKYYEQAIALDTWYGPAHYSLALLLHQQGNTSAAIGHYQRALEVNRDWAEAHNNLGNAYVDLGQFPEAIASYQAALAQNPDLVSALYNLGICFHALGKLPEAIACYEQALHLNPEDADAHNNLGSLYLELNRLPDAISEFQAAITANPELLAAHYNLAYALQRHGNLTAARDRYGEVLLRNNKHPEALLQMGHLCLAENDLLGAITHYQRCLSLAEMNGPAHGGLGTALFEMGDLTAAQEHYHQAIHLMPTDAELRLNWDMLLLLQGKFELGWREYEWRWHQGEAQLRQYPQPRWQGEALAGKTIFVYAEQGLGDCIQFCRLLPLLHHQGARVLFEGYPPLIRLLQSLAGVTLIEPGEVLPQFDVHSPLLSLPQYLGIDLNTIPGTVPYLTPPPSPLPLAGDRKIGLVWASRTLTKTAAKRSCPLEELLPLTEMAGVSFYSLQKERSPAEVEQLMAAGITDCSPSLNDLADTAALIQQLDLVITVDTVVAHLAGAIAKPVWILLPQVPDWRWLWHRSDSPWYPTAQLFRQPDRGDWPGAIAQVKLALEKFF